MMNYFSWMLFLILPNMLVMTLPLERYQDSRGDLSGPLNLYYTSKPENTSSAQNSNQIISVRITSSVAVGRGNRYKYNNNEEQRNHVGVTPFRTTDNNMVTTQENKDPDFENPTTESVGADNKKNITEMQPGLEGANLEFIKQLRSRTTERVSHNFDSTETSQIVSDDINTNNTENDNESSILSMIDIEDIDKSYDDFSETIPIARSVSSQSFKNIFEDVKRTRHNKSLNDKITTVSFNIVHDTPSIISNYNSENNHRSVSNLDLQNYYSNLPKDYSQPSQVYSEPAKIYSEPAKIYSEPAKVYSEPAKVYSEPAKYYSEPASLHLPHDVTQVHSSWYSVEPSTSTISNNASTTPITPNTAESTTITAETFRHPHKESNYEVDENISVMTNGRTHGIQESSAPESCKHDNCKVGYVVEGRQYRKYRVEERTSDGFIVGEYGVVRNVDGALRGVRYTADSEASPRLIYDALMKFLQL